MSIFVKGLIAILCGAKLLVPSAEEPKEVTNDAIIEKLTHDINLLNNSLDALKVRLEDSQLKGRRVEVTVGCECEKLLQAQTDITEKMEEMYKMAEIEKLNR